MIYSWHFGRHNKQIRQHPDSKVKIYTSTVYVITIFGLQIFGGGFMLSTHISLSIILSIQYPVRLNKNLFLSYKDNTS